MCFDAIIRKNACQLSVFKAFGTRSGTGGGVPMEGKRRHCVDMTREEYNKMRGGSVREVAATHGTISFKDVLLLYQEE